MDELIDSFSKIFSGYTDAYGVHQYTGEPDKNGKRQGKSFTKSVPVTKFEYYKHIEGEVGLGIIPIDKEGNCNFAVIDVDDYTNDLSMFRTIVHDYRLPLFPFTSKSGGLHLYLFFSEPTSAKEVVPFMQEVVATFGLPKDTEIFPKQTRIKEGELGNWINLPYFANGEKQYLMDRRGLAVPLAEALALIESGRSTLSKIKAMFADLPLADGPPCMQSIILRKTTNNRNTFFLSYGVYAKAKWEDSWESNILTTNQLLDDPLPETELKSTVIKSLSKETYAYKCKSSPLCDFCAKEICKQRQFGISSSMISGIDFGTLTQVLTDPPHYVWLVGGTRMRFDTEQDLLKQDRFRQLCFRELHKLPQRVKEETWTSVLQRALDNIEVQSLEVDVLSEGAIMWEAFEEFLIDRSHAPSLIGVSMNQVYVDMAQSEFCFKGAALLKFFTDNKGLKNVKNAQVHEMLTELGAKQVRERAGPMTQIRFVRLPFAAIGYNPSDSAKSTHEVDFGDFEQEEWDK